MIYLLVICFLVIYIPATYRLHKVKKHDGVLFPFCQLRRDIMMFLYENVLEKPGTLSDDEYRSVRRLLRTLDDAIHNYNHHKTLMFNLRKMVKYIRQYRGALKQMDALELTDNHEIQMFHERFVLCLAKAFFAYTPLIRWELALKLVALAYRVGHRGTSERLRQQYVFAGAKRVRDTVYDNPHGLAT